MFKQLEEELVEFYVSQIEYIESHHEIPPPSRMAIGTALVENIKTGLNGQKLSLVLANAWAEAWFRHKYPKGVVPCDFND